MKTEIFRAGARAALLCSMLALAACGSLLKKEAPPAPAPVADALPNPQVLLLGEVPDNAQGCLLYTSPSPRDRTRSRMPSSA